MTVFMDQSEKIDRIAVDGIANIIRKRRGATTGKTVRPDVVAAIPFDDFPSLPRNSFFEVAGQTLGDQMVLCRFCVQIIFETAAENGLHDG